MSNDHAHNDEPNTMYIGGLLASGLMIGFGIVHLYFSFGWEGGPLNQDFGGVGFSGLDNLSLLPASNYSIGMIVAGVIDMVWLNANAWKRTDGY